MQEKETLDEKLPGLFEPDTLLPIQYFEAMRRKHLLEGEKRLILSVLEDAIECFMKCIDSPTNKGQRLFREADEWIFLEDKRWVFSFDNVADMLDINPEYMRRGLREWKERKLADLERQATMKLEAEAVAPAVEAVEASVETPKPIEAVKPQFATAGAGSAKVFRPRTSRRKKATMVASARSGRNMRKAHA
jgi:transposase-like protein